MSSEDVGSDINQQLSETTAAPVQEPMLPQSKVNELVANAKLVSAKKAREEMELQYRQQMQAQQGQQMGGMQQAQPQMEQPDFGALIEAKLAEKERAIMESQQRQQMDELAKDYMQKMEQGETLYPDFKQVTGKYDPAKFYEVTIMAAQMPNTADVMYELNKNPMKLTHLKQLAAIDYGMALDEVQKLSASITRNEEAVQNGNLKSPSPLSRPRASIAGADSGKKTIRDLRKLDFLKV